MQSRSQPWEMSWGFVVLGRLKVGYSSSKGVDRMRDGRACT
jgi:hypothetical protein